MSSPNVPAGLVQAGRTIKAGCQSRHRRKSLGHRAILSDSVPSPQPTGKQPQPHTKPPAFNPAVPHADCRPARQRKRASAAVWSSTTPAGGNRALCFPYRDANAAWQYSGSIGREPEQTPGSAALRAVAATGQPPPSEPGGTGNRMSRRVV